MHAHYLQKQIAGVRKAINSPGGLLVAKKGSNHFDNNVDSQLFLVEVCWHYYVNEMTQGEVAKHLGVTRLRVNKAIQQAKELGIVKIQLESPFLSRFELQQQLQQKFDIKRAIVAPAKSEHYDYHRPTGAALAYYLTEKLNSEKWKKIGVSWGMTLQSAIQRLKRHHIPELEIISIIGGTSSGVTFNTFDIASGFAKVLGANYSLLTAPVFLSEGVNRKKFLSQKIFTQHFEKYKHLDAAILTASDISPKSYLIESGLPAEVSKKDLISMGAVGDVVGIFLGKDGKEIQSPLKNRTIGIDLEQLQKVPDRILAAAGPHKVKIINAAINHNLVTTLITDDITAELLLKL
jgi:DNA-binding transcriptional regulator LsrR (DeoR family)